MSLELKVEIIHREIIKPSSPTPLHSKTLHLSFLDQISPEVLVPLLLVYPNHDDDLSSIADKSTVLKASLSQTLTHYYPFAGKFRHNDLVRCDDQGALFIEARVNCRLSHVSKLSNIEILQRLFPTSEGHLLQVQVNLYECGGMAIAVKVSHKVADAFTLSKFMQSWSTIALIGSSSSSATTIDHHHPSLPLGFSVATSLYPPQDFMNESPKPRAETIQVKCTSKRFVFGGSSVAALKSKAVSVSVPNPTRVEVVSALIWKCCIEASRSNLGLLKPSSWCQMVNMRKRSGRAFTENLLGNFVWNFEAILPMETVLDLQNLVATLRKGLDDYKVKHPNGITAEEIYQAIEESRNLKAKDDIDKYTCSSWCRFPLYETDFGWGKPSWVSFVTSKFKNFVVLMDAKDGNGVVASLTLLEEDMTIVESNQELLAYASLNPSVI